MITFQIGLTNSCQVILSLKFTYFPDQKFELLLVIKIVAVLQFRNCGVLQYLFKEQAQSGNIPLIQTKWHVYFLRNLFVIMLDGIHCADLNKILSITVTE